MSLALTREAMSTSAVLETQHRKVERLIVGVGEVGADTPALVMELSTHLMAHMAVEEEFLYPIVRALKPGKVAASYEEHTLLAFGLTRLMIGNISRESFKLKVTAIGELFYCHSADEELSLFGVVMSTLGDLENEALARKMEWRFAALLAMGYQACRSARGKTSPSLRGALS
jgi:hypothetical protein